MFFKYLTKCILLFYIIFSFSSGSFANQDKIQEAKQFLNKFQKLSHEYDTKIVSMYADSAKIIRLVEHSNGNIEKVKLPVKGYKKMLRFASFFAKMKGYKNHYKELVYKIEDGNIRITGKRVNSDGYKAPISLLIGETPAGELKILEEKTATKDAFLVKQVFTKMK